MNLELNLTPQFYPINHYPTMPFKDYTNLKHLDAHNCGLKKVIINNSPNLEVIFLHYNRLKKILGLNKLTKLEKTRRYWK